MIRADICPSDDHDSIARLMQVLHELEFHSDDDEEPGAGLQRFHRGTEELTVYIDAWMVDICGSSESVNRVLAALGE